MPNYEISDLTRHVAGSIRGLMTRHGVSQQELADAIGVSQSHLSKMVRGVRAIELDQLDAMCMALGADTAAVVKEAEDFLGGYLTLPTASLIYVEEGIRLDQPYDMRAGEQPEPVVPEYRPRSRRTRTNVGGSAEDYDVTPTSFDDLGLAAKRGKRKVDTPHAE